jgi:hypothetical protein
MHASFPVLVLGPNGVMVAGAVSALSFCQVALEKVQCQKGEIGVQNEHH